MIIIPELHTIMVCPPRTASTSFKKAILEKHPKSFMLYRHMEANHIPIGYDSWRKIGIVRHPVDRLWSLFNYCKGINIGRNKKHNPEWREDNLVKPYTEFTTWLLHNEKVFSNSYFSNTISAQYATSVMLPETKKSQWHTLRPDLGTQVYTFDQRNAVANILGIELDVRHNASDSGRPPELCLAEKEHIDKYFEWDLSFFEE